MCKGLIGKKLGMTGLFSPEGKHFPVTVLRVGPCVVTQVKMVATDGYNALQLGFGEKKKSRTNKPIKGHLKRSGEGCFEQLREFSVDNPGDYEPGQILSPDMFKVGERIDVTANSKGRGFSGVIKRYGFHGGGETHGSHSHRVTGSIGSSAWPSRVVKGKKMPGHYGNEQNTTKNLEIADIRPKQNLIFVKGAVPGFRSGLVSIKKRKLVK
ncbi:MAG: 50S ribosomal protein L3 [Desulfobacteraceae bacterium]|nr:50S ribosomal protein L3 [Pseudomonadota bacterium]MBU4464141.1 50S ribosomal protein L3 [Pseudomonadota bacterium]MCG2755283.1 50S ribosomal protein L3 [Desulfobacteraceae bacterium]